MIEQLKKDLESYRAELNTLNTRLATVEEQRQAIIKAGLKTEALIFYITMKIEEFSKQAEEAKPQ